MARSRYLLTEKMREELLVTFRAAQEMSLDANDVISAEYYEMLVKHLVGLKPVKKKDYVETKSLDTPLSFSFKKVIAPKMSLKETEAWLIKQSDMTPEEKFDLYYEERERIKSEKGSRAFNKMLKELGISPAKK